jgi:hypothetical protein
MFSTSSMLYVETYVFVYDTYLRTVLHDKYAFIKKIQRNPCFLKNIFTHMHIYKLKEEDNTCIYKKTMMHMRL